jgi:hypothetical protein
MVADRPDDVRACHFPDLLGRNALVSAVPALVQEPRQSDVDRRTDLSIHESRSERRYRMARPMRTKEGPSPVSLLFARVDSG